MAKNGMTNSEIRAIVTAEKRAALGSNTNSDLQRQRSDATDYYMGDMDEHMPVHEGGSRAVSTDVADVVETLLPSLLDIFMSSDNVVEFPAKGEEDEEAAAQETDVVNHIFWNQNAGFTTMYSMIKDALISKVGFVKIWWEEVEEAEKETYEGLDEAGYIAIVQDPEVKIIAQSIEIDEDTGEQTISLEIQKRDEYGKIRIECVPPEEFGIAHDAKSIQESHYCYHTYEKSRSDLIAMGYDRKVVEKLPTGRAVEGEEDYSRNTVEEDTYTSGNVNTALAKVEVTEHYVRLDKDGDGIAELLQVITAGTGNEILSVEEIDRMPFASICPIPITHRFFGKSIADITMDIMRIKTHLYRALLDNASLLNNQRMAIGSVGSNENTIDDLLTNRPGGIVRMEDISQIREIPNQQIGPHIMPLLEYTDQARETRTGVTRHSMGIDADALNKASGTATGFKGLMDMSHMRIKTIARIFAETGIKDLFIHIHELLRKHQQKDITLKIRNKWITVNPRVWKTRNDMNVTVGLGTGSKEQVLGFLNTILERQIQAIQFQGGVNGPLVGIDNIHATLKKMVESAGFRNADLYFKEPDPNMEMQDRPDPEQMKLQAEQQKDQAKLQLEKQKADADIQIQREKAQAQIQFEREKAALEEQLAREKAQAELALAEQKMAMEERLAMQKMEYEANMAAHKTNMDAEVKLSTNRPGGALDQ